MTRKTLLTTLFAAVIAASGASANDINERITALAANQLSGWLNDPALLDAIRAQNAEHAGLSQSDIDNLDQTWRAEASAAEGPLIERLLSSSVSEYLRGQQMNTDGMVTEVFIMDNRGLNVAQSDVTSDYWQGDEAKFQETFGKSSGSVHIGDVEFDESSGTYQVQVSLSISDPENGSPIGAATFGISME